MTIEEAYAQVYEAIDPRLRKRCTVHITATETIDKWLNPPMKKAKKDYTVYVYHHAEGQWSQLLCGVTYDGSLKSAVRLALKHLNDSGRAYDNYQKFLKENK